MNVISSIRSRRAGRRPAGAPTPAYAQLDPLLFLKTTQPNVILAVDTSQRMQSTLRTPITIRATTRDTLAPSRRFSGSTRRIRRRATAASTSTMTSVIQIARRQVRRTEIEAVGDREDGYTTFYERTRLAIAGEG